MKMVKFLKAMTLVVFGLLLSAHAEYLLGINESSEGFTINTFGTDGEHIQTYGTVDSELDNIVYAGGNTVYGWLGEDYQDNSTLYKYVIDDVAGTMSTHVLNTYSDVGGLDAIALAGDTLYTWSYMNNALYSVDLTGDLTAVQESVSGRLLGAHVEAMAYDAAENTLYITRYDNSWTRYSQDVSVLYAIDLDDTELSATELGYLNIDDPEGMAITENGDLYVASDNTLYAIDLDGASSGTWISSSVAGSLDWASTIEGLSSFASITSVPEPSSALVWLLVVGGVSYMRRRSCAA